MYFNEGSHNVIILDLQWTMSAMVDDLIGQTSKQENTEMKAIWKRRQRLWLFFHNWRNYKSHRKKKRAGFTGATDRRIKDKSPPEPLGRTWNAGALFWACSFQNKFILPKLPNVTKLMVTFHDTLEKLVKSFFGIILLLGTIHEFGILSHKEYILSFLLDIIVCITNYCMVEFP